MPGKACVDFRNGFYHIYNRGVNKQNIFCDDEDRWNFINLCKKTKLKYDVVFLAFCLMGNHYHLFIHTPQANLSKAMKYIDERFSKYFIRKYKADKKSGHTFMGPYGRRIVQTDRYASTLLAYIHNNPLKDGFVEHPVDYKWSSYNYYESGFGGFGFIDKDLLSGNFVPVARGKQGKALISSEQLNWEPDDHTLAGLFLGDIHFTKNIFEKHLQGKPCFADLQFFDKLKHQINSKVIRELINSIDINPVIYRNILIYSLLEWSELQASELEDEFAIKAGTLRKIKFTVNQKIKTREQNYLGVIDAIKDKCNLC